MDANIHNAAATCPSGGRTVKRFRPEEAAALGGQRPAHRSLGEAATDGRVREARRVPNRLDRGGFHGGKGFAGERRHERPPQPPRIAVLRSELPPARPVALAAEIDYVPGSIVSRTLAKTRRGSLTLFAFDQGQEPSEHTAPFDAFVQALDGAAELTIGGEAVPARAGETVRMPAGIPHAVRAAAPFKMLFSLIREEREGSDHG